MRLASWLLLSVLSVSLVAQETPIVADRPGFADGSGTVGAGTVQLEVGVTLDDGDDSVLSLPTLLRWGLSDAFELRFESDVLRSTGGDREIAPFGAGFKLRLCEGEAPLSLLASIEIPSGEGASKATQFGTEVRLVSDLDLGGGYSLTPNVGLALAEGGETSAVVAASLGKEVGNAAPFVDFELRAGQGKPSMVVDGGIAWIVRNETQLDIAGGVIVAGDDSSDWFLTAGISRRF